MSLDLKKVKKIYIVGIKGSGVVAFAEIFHTQGKEVVGSDVDETFFTDETLKRLGIRFYEGFNVENVKKEMPIDLIIYSTTYNENNNREIRYAKENNIDIISYPELIGLFLKPHFGIAVCGTHGKTTTTAMLALAMKEAGADPTAIIGSKVKQLKSNVMIGKSNYFIIEADEYQNKLSKYDPLGVILTSIDYDHPDYFKTFNDYKKVFEEFIKKIPKHGFLAAWGESADVVQIAKKAKCRIIFYGIFANEQLENDLREECEKMNVAIIKVPSDLSLDIPGKHNLLNATAVIAVGDHLALDRDKIIKSLKEYRGAARRFELIGESNGAILIDDYAHHPEEIRATLAAAQEKYPSRNTICVFHPHTYSRTRVLLDEFSQSFENADEVIVLDIYGSAREKDTEDIHSKDLVKKIMKYKQNVEYIPTIEECYAYLRDKIDQNDVVITMGAGNVWELNAMLIDQKII
ncbi:MAG: UDP-N-acetylmuramate--L-alanine ligase [Patescibacteria group bacterium]|nr:UDP-N-acetylmuramate--L-alanine ligase [Patescibacteria group bacterium]